MWNHDRQLSQDVLVGLARLPLGDVITADKTKVMVSVTTSPVDRFNQFLMNLIIFHCCKINLSGSRTRFLFFFNLFRFHNLCFMSYEWCHFIFLIIIIYEFF